MILVERTGGSKVCNSCCWESCLSLFLGGEKVGKGRFGLIPRKRTMGSKGGRGGEGREMLDEMR